MNINSSVYCGSNSACSSSAINAENIVACGGIYSCLSSTIKYARYLYCTGLYSCLSVLTSQIQNTYVLARGASLKIVSGGIDVNVYFLATQDRYGANSVTCDSGDNCYIECGTNDACTNLFVYCNGNCTIICDESNGIQCPIGM